MRSFLEQFQNILMFGVLPNLVAITIFLSVILIKFAKKKVESPIEEFCESRKQYKIEGIYARGIVLLKSVIL